MNKALVIGAAGFVGPYLIQQLAQNGYEVAATKLAQEELSAPAASVFDLDILQPESVAQLLNHLQPDVVYHLAAQSSVGLSWKNPVLTVDINVNGTLHVLEAVRKLQQSTRVVLIGSSEEYGPVKPGEVPVAETVAPNPQNVYAITKNTQNRLGMLYAKAYGMDILCTRSFNHVGPGQTPQFVVADFCKQIAEIEAGHTEPCIRVGNLAAKRDFTDVRDVVCAYSLLAEKGIAGETYNVGSGKAVAVQELLDCLLAMAQVPIKVEIDTLKYRPVDVPVVEADIQKLAAATGWAPKIPLEKTLAQTLEYWRKQVRQE